MKQEWKAIGSYGTLGLEVALSVVLGVLIGQWLDGRLGTEPVMTGVWFLFGLAAGGRAIWRSWKEMQVEAAREEREQGNPAPMFEDEKEKEREAKRKAEDERWRRDEVRDSEPRAEGRDES